MLVDDLKDQLEDAHAEIATLKTVVKQKDDEIAHLKSNTHYSNYASMTLQKEISSLRRRSEKRITELETTLSNSTQVLSLNTTTEQDILGNNLMNSMNITPIRPTEISQMSPRARSKSPYGKYDRFLTPRMSGLGKDIESDMANIDQPIPVLTPNLYKNEHIRLQTPTKREMIDSVSARVQRLTPIKSEPSEKKQKEKIGFPCFI